ncbi:MAG: hypothetical protein EGQ81_02410 [Akkermansia sp.]|nr:hypothetical protein [Akkermansia sp.]
MTAPTGKKDDPAGKAPDSIAASVSRQVDGRRGNYPVQHQKFLCVMKGSGVIKYAGPIKTSGHSFRFGLNISPPYGINHYMAG